MPIRHLFFILLFFPVLLFAQAPNDECIGAIPLEDLNAWCSTVGEYTNENATESDWLLPDCFGNNIENKDVWFSFIAGANNLSLSIVGSVGINPGGLLTDPEVAIYEGNCSDLNLLECETDLFALNQVAVSAMGLMIGETYFIRVSARFGDEGSFQLCANNFNTVPEPSGDCNPGVVLCDQSTFTTGFVFGAGDDPNELNNVSCNSATCNLTESSSTWYKWVCDEAGTLEFAITPLNPDDDLDFVLFELPNGINDCSGMFDLRCMASGENLGEPLADWVNCTGATGMSVSDADISETCGCQDGDNNFVEAITMEVGKAYALLINNFSQSGNGFSIDFGGTGTFLGPDVNFEFSPQEDICLGETITYMDASTFVGNITTWSWDFGPDAIPQTASGQGPHVVTYTNAGNKMTLLQIETEMGCFSTSVQNTITVVCCESSLDVMGEITNVPCDEDSTGSIILNLFPVNDGYTYFWDSGQTTADISNLAAGEYNLTVTDGVFCERRISFVVEQNEVFEVDTLVSQISACIGNNGSIELTVTGGTAPFQFDWNDGNGFVNNNHLENLSSGTFTINILDAANCSQELEVTLDMADPTSSDYSIPNVFTPNGDELNDVFKVYVHESIVTDVEILTFQVFNRWGELVFESNQVNEGWNGYFNGEPAQSDTYIYRLEMKLPCEEATVVEMGEIALMR